ncbi:MAG TPA: DUF2079 domain-containing protein [Candidatus Omnitrophota bacterium]|nr:DUF2079 domain-containing protein [Candidatus Omnitrophota bacterium]HPS20372.1 DUF2079 domain-containing protein [Candidatus Omnitrophota bacterium]
MWNMIHGHPYISIIDKHFLGNHFNVIAFLFSPVFFIFRHPLTLLCLQTLCISLTSIPIYLIARKYFSWTLSSMLALAYFAFPSLLYIEMYEFHFETVSILPVALTFFFLLENKKIWAIIAAILAVLCKENIPLVVGAIGLYGLLFLRGRRLVGTFLLLIGIFSFFLITLKLQPLFTSNRIGYVSHYSGYGKTFSDVFFNMATHPMDTLKELASTELKRSFFFKMFAPLLFLPVLRPDVLLIIAPTVIKNLLSNVPTTHEIFWHYTATMIPFMIISLIFALRTLSRMDILKQKLHIIMLVILIAELSCSFKFYKEAYTFFCSVTPATNTDILRHNAVKHIPKDASVISTFDFLPQLSMRKDIFVFYSVWRDTYRSQHPTDYAIVDFNDYFIRKDICIYPEKISDIFTSYLTNTDWNALYSCGDIVVFAKGKASGSKLLRVINTMNTTISNSSFIQLDKSLELVNYKATFENNIMTLTFDWRKIKNPSSFYDMYFVISDGVNQQVFEKHPVAYWYNFHKLENNALLEETYKLVLPPNLEPGSYTISVIFGDVLKQKKADVTILNKAAFDDKMQLVLGTYTGYTQ